MRNVIISLFFVNEHEFELNIQHAAHLNLIRICSYQEEGYYFQ